MPHIMGLGPVGGMQQAIGGRARWALGLGEAGPRRVLVPTTGVRSGSGSTVGAFKTQVLVVSLTNEAARSAGRRTWRVTLGRCGGGSGHGEEGSRGREVRWMSRSGRIQSMAAAQAKVLVVASMAWLGDLGREQHRGRSGGRRNE